MAEKPSKQILVIESLLKKRERSFQELAQEGTRQVIRVIDTAIKNDDRAILLQYHVALDSIEKILDRTEKRHNMMADAINAASDMVDEGVVREFSRTAMFMEMVSEIIEKAQTEGRKVEHFQLRILKDITEGQGPLLPETVKELEEMKSFQRESAEKLKTGISLDNMGEDADEIAPIIGYLALVIENMLAKASEKLNDKLGVQNIIYAPPTQDDRNEIINIIREGVPLFEELVEAMKDESLGMGM